MKALDAALAEWAAGRHYEAHEHLEDVAETFEEDDPSFAIALALVQVAASFHKLAHNVAPSAVPGKLDRALVVLEGAPPDWQGLDLGSFVASTKALRARLAGVSAAVPSGLDYPTLERRRG